MKAKDEERLKKIGKKILALREGKNLSQDKLASLCDVDRGKISKMENGTANYNITTIIELAKGLGISPKDFLDIDFNFNDEND